MVESATRPVYQFCLIANQIKKERKKERKKRVRNRERRNLWMKREGEAVMVAVFESLVEEEPFHSSNTISE